MAKKIFRLHEGGASANTGWFNSNMITSDDLRTIKTEGKEVATSIPTPFATIDLVKSAFKWVSENGIDGTTAHHKLVSDALDVAQLFYTSEKFGAKVSIIAWDPKKRFGEIQNSGNMNHQSFGKALQLYWDQDSVPQNQINNLILYNFEKTNRLFLILDRATNRVIGGTSPATLFFASPDVRTVASDLNITIGQNELFDETFNPLYQRDTSFIIYFYTLSKQPQFAQNFPEVYEYLESTKKQLTSDVNEEVTKIVAQDINNYETCKVLANDNDTCEILGIPLGVQQSDAGNILGESDFIISSDFPSNQGAPLVLPQYPFSKSPQWTYTTKGIVWDENTKISYKNDKSSKDSRLPIQNDQYHWLTLGNFLADTIIELPYPIDDSKFITCGSTKYLLPLTPTFFKYFKAENVNKYLSLTERAGGNIEAVLKIPVRGGNITFKKQYSSADKNIENLFVHMAIMPFLKSQDFELKHTIGIIDDRSEKSNELKICMISNNNFEFLKSGIKRNPGEGFDRLSKYFKTEKQPDAIGLALDQVIGFTVPIMRTIQGSTEVNFAVDFGTTNTHIEYRLSPNEAKGLDNPVTTPLWQSLLNRRKNDVDQLYIDNERTFEQEILPYVISAETDINFPLRTALVHNKGIDFSEEVEIISQVNNYLLFEKYKVPGYLEFDTQLKWSNYSNIVDERKVEAYLEFLTTMVYYKTLQLGGNPAKSTITWFYPVSMDEGELGVFFKLWGEIYKKVFKQSTANGIKGIPESIAPYLFYKSTIEGLSLSIDVGGGSSDIAVFDEDDKTAKLISSFKFAGNAIFGDGYPSKEYKNNSDKNGFVKAFKNSALEAVKNDQQKEAILKGILNDTKNSADFSSYLFSLEQDKTSKFSYSKLLVKDQQLKLIFLVFYGAISYYSARLLKKSGIGIPKYILLSGTASKTAAILDASVGLNNLSQMMQFIFEQVYHDGTTKNTPNIQVKLSEIPKEVTCKGALKADIEDSIKETPTKFWIGGVQEDIWGEVLDREQDVRKTPKYGELNDQRKEEIESSIKDYYAILDNYIEGINLKSKFIIEPGAYEVFKGLRDEGIRDLLVRGIHAYYKKSDSKIEESLFFYPLIGILNKLSFALANNQNNDA